ncbi:MAG TPA: TetR/AcrR family transcriptional regulator [Smithella sp.]|nr:TetR/AcrR family transcriptional regulator [Smithella sp.]
MNKSERTKNYIVEVASPIFNKKGYAGTSISDVLAGTGLTKGSIYGNFKNKDELAVAVLEYNLSRSAKLIYSSINSKANACDRLIKFAESFRKYYDAIMNYGGCPVMNAAVDSDDGNPLIKKKVIKFIKLWKQSIEAIIKDGKKNNEFKSNSDAEGIAMLLVSIIEGSLMLSKATGEKKYIENAIDHIIELIDGLRAR